MSVLKNLRKISRYEFEYHYTQFYYEYKDRIDSLPQRKQEFVGKPLLKSMNQALESVMRVNQYLFTKKEYRKEERDNLIKKAIDDVYAIQKPLFVYWNVEMTPIKKQARLCNFLDKEIFLLNNYLDEKYMKQFIIIDWESVKNIQFIANMCELHRVIHQKIIRAIYSFENAETPFLANLIDTALYETLNINKIYPQTKEQYLERENKVDTILELLNSMAIPLLSYFSLMQYSESEQKKIYDLINKEEKLLNGLLKSDKKHFSYLLKED